jgi:NTP pyrophosphatase (non-canonical NTP hydrolase)
MLALIHSEVSEALEAFRVGDRENFEEELADIAIRLLDLAGGLHINLDQRIAEKMEKNRKRGFRHGGKAL